MAGADSIVQNVRVLADAGASVRLVEPLQRCGRLYSATIANEPAANEPAANEPAANEPAANERAAENTASTDVALMVTAALAFGHDARGRVQMTGACSVKLPLSCPLCLEPVLTTVSVEVDLRLLSEAEAGRLSETLQKELDFVVVEPASADLLLILEDELLLVLPSQVCPDDACERRPQLSYGPLRDVPAEQIVKADRKMPFAGLKTLLAEDLSEDLSEEEGNSGQQ